MRSCLVSCSILMPLASTLASTVFAAFIVSILQFPNKNTGDFNTGDGTNDMNTLFDLARINLLFPT